MDIEGAVLAVHEALAARRISHILIGRYAVELAMCNDPDNFDWRYPVLAILVDGFQGHVMNVILSSSELFSYTEAHGLMYTSDLGYINADSINIEIFESDREPYFFPLAYSSASLRFYVNHLCDVVVLHPKVHVIVAARLWNMCAAQWLIDTYLGHVRCLLRWLAGRRMKIDFEGCRGTRKAIMLSTFSTLYHVHEELGGLLQSVMHPEDFRAISGGDIAP